ncbi:hypothetical protein WN944_027301 [Citrus x changshan-huyou]|uniref:Uncharacterized protein n=1 Tax=Citrus x changshan-huyou TaxID=2935761 RepID=A0AAP0Q8E0_9ROSI
MCCLALVSGHGSLAMGLSTLVSHRGSALSLLCRLCSLDVESPSILTVDCISRLASTLLPQLQWLLAAVVKL